MIIDKEMKMTEIEQLQIELTDCRTENRKLKETITLMRSIYYCDYEKLRKIIDNIEEKVKLLWMKNFLNPSGGVNKLWVK